MLQATSLAWSLWVVVPISQASEKYAIANMLLSRSFAFAAALNRRWSMPFTRVSHCCEIWHHTVESLGMAAILPYVCLICVDGILHAVSEAYE